MWSFIKSASGQDNWFRHEKPEVCFIGRSNVGKSSLINALANAKVARISNTPGRTQLINFFAEKQRVYVDLPGYGYAQMPLKLKRQMLVMVNKYLINRPNLKKICVLMDAKVGPTKDDLAMIDFLLLHDRDFFVILTKADKANQKQLNATIKSVKSFTKDYLLTSTLKGQNIAKLNKIIQSFFN